MSLVPGSAAATRTIDGEVFVFCSRACIERFDADPLQFVPTASKQRK
jgi:YHS domain-containing protein